MINCPACAGPYALGGNCATCFGVTEVTQEVYDNFMEQKQKRDRFFRFVSEVQDRLGNGIDLTMSFTIGEDTLEYTP